jgi:chromosome partitioning protein
VLEVASQAARAAPAPARIRIDTMRRIAIINQKGGVGKTTTTANLGAALALQGRRVVVVDMDAQANLTLALGVEPDPAQKSSYSVLVGTARFDEALVDTTTAGLRLLPANIDLSGAELELASAMGREFVLRDALCEWNEAEKARTGRDAADYILFDCPPSLGLLAINSLSAAGEVLITLQTEFLALQGMSKLVEVVQLLKKRLNPELQVAGILPCMYDSRKRLAREVLGEIRSYFKGQVLPVSIRSNVKLAEAPSYGKTIFSYAADSSGAQDYMDVARLLIEAESRFPDMRGLPAFDAAAKAPLDADELARRAAAKARRPPPRRGPTPLRPRNPRPTTRRRTRPRRRAWMRRGTNVPRRRRKRLPSRTRARPARRPRPANLAIQSPRRRPPPFRRRRRPCQILLTCPNCRPTPSPSSPRCRTGPDGPARGAGAFPP